MKGDINSLNRNIMDVLTWAASVAIPLTGGFLGASVTAGQIKTWYQKLKKPSWTPPNWLFGPAWTTLYVLMGSASWMVWKQGGFAAQMQPLMIYGASLVANFAWTPLFFGLHRLDLALVDILALLALEGATVHSFSKVIGIQASLLTLGPLMAWTSYATALNFTILRMNPTAISSLPSKGAQVAGEHSANTQTEKVQSSKEPLLSSN
ncbi:hypothetical protein CEUSTIGMA_g27.t1 [Chlamydomonas eustigma]|uniref:TspO/MBR-related protein n=1 Tax=Chlamydomonas eustigma TaxID=1157962 RepID=A0A250WP62_9CHLO|nr:hypothetical protein CEUSTIGMA_g27.t1 [Chlamydomonas eustigma]|eukprot:GAX72571.1 hypothetical protein CEUSTIGMA_g27.t1 [Chlamydomonas eustigma]